MAEKIQDKIMQPELKIKLNKNIGTTVYTWLCAGIVYTAFFWTCLNSILCILLVIWWLFFSKKEFRITTDKTKLMLLFCSLYLVFLTGMIYTANLKAGFATLEKQSALFLFPLIFGTTSVSNPSFIKIITRHLVIAASITCLVEISYGLFNFIRTGSSDSITGYGLLLFHALRPPLLGLFCLLSLIIVFKMLSSATKNIRTWLWVSIGLITVTVFLLSIRLIIFCWLLIMFYFMWKQLYTAIQKFSIMIILLAGIVITGFTVPRLKNKWKELMYSPVDNSFYPARNLSPGKNWGGKAIRFAIWTCSLDILKNHWLTGVGTGDVQDSLQQAYANRRFYFASGNYHYNAHNQYLQVSLANGMPGLLIFIMCIFYPLLFYRQKFSGEIYLMFLLVFAVACTTESLLHVNKGIIGYSFFNSLFAFGFLKQGD